MDYKVVVTRDAEEDLDRFIKYLIFEKENIKVEFGQENGSLQSYTLKNKEYLKFVLVFVLKLLVVKLICKKLCIYVICQKMKKNI